MEICALRPASPEGSNCWLITDNGHAVVVDPSASAGSILRAAENAGCTLDAVLLTHGHFDHIVSVDTLRVAQPGLRVFIHAGDAPMLGDGEKNAFTLFFGGDRRYADADDFLAEGQTIPVGNTTLTVLHTPGHSPGSVCFWDEAHRILLTGDTLFSMGVGRADLWQGDASVLRDSLDRLRAFMAEHTTDDTPAITIYPGHDRTSTLPRALAVADMIGF